MTTSVKDPNIGPLITYEEAAAILGGVQKPVSIRHVERLVAARRLRRKGRGRARRIVHSSIVAYIETEGSDD